MTVVVVLGRSVPPRTRDGLSDDGALRAGDPPLLATLLVGGVWRSGSPEAWSRGEQSPNYIFCFHSAVCDECRLQVQVCGQDMDSPDDLGGVSHVPVGGGAR